MADQNRDSDIYENLFTKVSGVILEYRQKAHHIIHQMLVKMYWEIGKRVVVYFQDDEPRAHYNENMLQQLSNDLTKSGERGFSVTNLRNMRLLYLTYPDENLLHSQIKWSHYQVLIRLNSPNTRRFYEEMIVKEKWSVEELEQQIHTFLHERTITYKGKEEELIAETRNSRMPLPTLEEVIRDPYVVNFLKLKDGQYQESDLEQAIISNLENFLLELGYGFTFAWRQKRIQIGSQFYYVDLVFFHRGLKCLVLVDLKIGKFTHADAGQMNMYLNYFRENERYQEENDPVGIILCADKEEETVRYALNNIKQPIFVSRYQTMLPPEQLLKERLIEEKHRYFQSQNAQEQIAKSTHPRKGKIFEHLKQYRQITVQEYQELAKVSRATAQRDLSQAVREGWLERHGKTRTAYYTLAIANAIAPIRD